MSNGLGAGFGFLLLVGVLLVVAGLLGVVTVAALVLRLLRSRVPVVVRYLAGGLLGVVVAVAGFGVLALYDEAWLGAVLLVALVWVPLAAVAGRARLAGRRWRVVVVTAAMAWPLPFAAGVALTFGVSVVGVPSPAVGAVLAGVVAAGGTLLVGEFLPRGLVEGAGT
ncbi:hypothetical protein [Halorarius halobius]|uniref:hypothetical protein n=1 Tax=Halorarius halobius TaxID=2962671 RepID=UPI0020CF5536|nr:hypothetical protein [Halorarius halobius]